MRPAAVTPPLLPEAKPAAHGRPEPRVKPLPASPMPWRRQAASRPSWRKAPVLASLLGGLIGLAAGWAQASDPSSSGRLPDVSVSGTRQPVEKPYRRLLEGMAWFQSQSHRLPPGRQLQFRFVPLVPGAEQGAMTLRVWTDDWTTSLPIQEGGVFQLPMRDDWSQDRAMISPSRPEGSLTWRVQIREPGASPWRLRLGDLRLECEVAYASGLLSFPSALPRFLQPAPPCTPAAKADDGPADYLLFAERPLFKVHLEQGGQRWELPLAWLHGIGASLQTGQAKVWQDRVYWLPLGDPCLSDDAEVVLTPVDLPGHTGHALAGQPPGLASAAVASVMQESGDVLLLPSAEWDTPEEDAPPDRDQALMRWGPTRVRRYASGHELWIYQADWPETPAGRMPAKRLATRCATPPNGVVPQPDQGTWRLLFDPAGRRIQQLRLPLPSPAR